MNSPMPAAAVTARHASTSRSTLRWSSVSRPPSRPRRDRRRGAPVGSRRFGLGPLLAVVVHAVRPVSSLAALAAGAQPADAEDQQAEPDYPGHEALGHRALAADRGAAAVEAVLVQCLDIGGDVIDPLDALAVGGDRKST